MSNQSKSFYVGKKDGQWWRRNLQKILDRKEKSIEIDDVDVMPACPAGENFAAEVLRVVVYGRRSCLGKWTGTRTYEGNLVKPKEMIARLRKPIMESSIMRKTFIPDVRKNFIVKKVPDPSSPCHRFYDCYRMFRNEVAAYECVLPLCQAHLEKSLDESPELPFPRYLGQCQQFLLLQDLQTEGYQQVNRVKGFSVRECSFVLRELSKFHAVSIALKKSNKTSLSKTIEKLQETIFREEHINDLTGIFWENSGKFALKSLEKSGDPRLQKASETLRLYSGRILKTLIEIVRPDYGKFDVFCHGDLWSNNILIRYCDLGYPIGVKFLDLQAMRYGSCVLDVMHILFTSSRPVIYASYFNLLLTEYYQTLISNLKKLETSPVFTLKEFLSEFKRKIAFGVFLACIMLTCVTRTSEPDSNVTSKHLTSEKELEKTYKALSPAYHERLRALILALTDSNLI